MPLYDNEKPRPDSPKIARPFNVVSVDGACDANVEELLRRLSQEYPKLLRDTDLLIGDWCILPFAIGESLGIAVPEISELLEERFQDLQFGDVSKRVVLTNPRIGPGPLFSTFRNPETPIARVFSETTPHTAYNDPSVLGLCYALDPLFGKAFLDEVCVLSVGAPVKDEHSLVPYQCEQLMDRQYHRIETENCPLVDTLQWLKEHWR